jgi:hypothetical protein
MIDVIKMQIAEHKKSSQPKIYRVKIYQTERGGYSFSFRHTGDFKLNDYDELDFEVVASRMVKRQ